MYILTKIFLHKAISKSFIVFIVVLLFIPASYAQLFFFGNEKIKWEVGLNFGPSFFLGDLGGNSGKGTNSLKDLNFKFTKMMKGAFIIMYPSKWAGIRVAANLTHLEGSDAIISTNGISELYRKERNLDFKTNVWELYGAMEFFPTMLFRKNKEYEPRIKPYVFGGIGVFNFNPKGSLTDEGGNKSWHYLQPLRTEGQGMPEYPERKPYKLTQVNIPYGGGIKYYASERINISMELLYRKTFTDYIDDVSTAYIDSANFTRNLTPENAALAISISDKHIPMVSQIPGRYPEGTQRGDPKDGDTYFSIIVKIGIRLGPIYQNSFAARSVKQVKCPVVY